MRYLGIGVVLLIALSLVAFAQSEDFSQAEAIIQQRIPYNQLSDDQFEQLGDYFMELMAGNNHEYMDAMIFFR